MGKVMQAYTAYDGKVYRGKWAVIKLVEDTNKYTHSKDTGLMDPTDKIVKSKKKAKELESSEWWSENAVYIAMGVGAFVSLAGIVLFIKSK